MKTRALSHNLGTFVHPKVYTGAVPFFPCEETFTLDTTARVHAFTLYSSY